MKRIVTVLTALLVSTTAMADRPSYDPSHNGHGPQSFISVTINGLTCASSAGLGAFDARSWSWGASNTVSGGGGSGSGTGRATINALTIRKAFDTCSPNLFGAVTAGRHFASLTLVDRDDDGVVVASLALTEVFVTSWTVGSTTRDETPDETVVFTFRKACLSGSGSTQMCYDATTGTTT